MREENKKITKRSTESLGAENSSIWDGRKIGRKGKGKGDNCIRDMYSEFIGKISRSEKEGQQGNKGEWGRMKCRKNVHWYYCKVCEAYSLSQDCYNKKSSKEDGKRKEKGGDTVAVKRTQGGLRKGEETANKGACNHKIDGLKKEDDTRYLL